MPKTKSPTMGFNASTVYRSPWTSRTVVTRKSSVPCIAGTITRDTLALYALGVPFMVAGLWSGFKLFGKIDDETFRKTVLLLLLLAGLSLIVQALRFAFRS